MKATSLKTAAVLAGTISLLAGNAMAQATTGVAGYETLPNDAGFNFVGVRLHEAPVASGTLETVTATTAEDADIDLGALIISGTYILEIEDGSGIIQEVTSATGSVLDVMDLSGVAPGAAYTLRPASTMASVLGNTAPTVALGQGFGSPAGADEVWLWNGAGFDKYYWDNLGGPTFAVPGWQIVGTTTLVDATTIDIIYADGFVISSSTGNDVVIAGDLKAHATELNLAAAAFSFVSSVGPVGDTLGNMWGTTAPTVPLTQGFGSPAGVDEVWVWNGTDFDKYYWDNLGGPTFAVPGWQIVGTTTLVDPATVTLGSGYVISSTAGGDVTQEVPGFYAGL